MTTTWVASTGVNSTAAARGTTSTNVAYVGVAAGRRAFLSVSVKPETATITTPSGWTLVGSATGGTGTSAADTGPTKVAVYYKDLVGSESGNVTVSTTASQTTGCMDVFSKSLSAWSPPAFVSGSDTVHDANFSAICGTWPDGGIKVTDSVLVAHSGDTDDAATATSAPTINQSGITFASVTERSQQRNNSGNQGMVYTWSAGVSSVTTRGTSNAAVPTVGFTWAVSSCGPAMVIRVRDQNSLAAQSDSFDDGSINTTLWSNNYGNTSEVGGRARIDTTTGYSAFSTSFHYGWADGERLRARLYPPASNGATSEAYQEMILASGTRTPGTELAIYLDMVSSNIYFMDRVGYDDAAPTSLTYDPVSHAWVGWIRSGSNILFQTSPDGTTWTTVRTLANPSWLPLTISDAQLFVQSHRSDGTANFAEMDFFNLTPTTVTSSLDTRWQVLSSATSALDTRWQVLSSVSSSLDTRWAVQSAVSSSLDARWAVSGTVAGSLDARWAVGITAGETIFTDADFTGGSFEEGSQLALGTRFHVTENGTAKRARFYCPASGPGGSGTVLMRLHAVTGGPSLLATATFSSPTFGAWNETDWIVGESPGTVPLVTGTVYSTSYVTPNRYVASTAYTWPKLSAGLRIESESPGGYFSSGDTMPGGTFGGNNYYADVVVEFGAGTTSVTASTDARWQVRDLVAGTLDARWTVSNTISQTLDLRWQVRSIVAGSTSLQWAVRNVASRSLDARWSVLVSATSSLDARWQVRAQALSSLDLRWSSAGGVSSSLDVRWAVKGLVTGTLDARWSVSGQITASLDARWQTRQRAARTVELQWVVDGEVFVPRSDVRAYLSHRVRSRPTLAQIRAYL